MSAATDDAEDIDLGDLLEARRLQLARDSLLEYTKLTNPEFVPGWFNAIICRELEQFYDDVQAGKSPRLMIFAPPRSGKSELVSRRFPAWAVGRDNRLKFISASYSAPLAESMSMDCRNIIADDELHGRIFPDARICPSWTGKRNTLQDWNIANRKAEPTRGAYLAAGVESMLTGRGANILIIDDPVKDYRDGRSATIQQRHMEWYESVFFTRRDVLKNGIILMCTRWHINDLAGQLLEKAKNGGDQWRVVRFPLIAEEDEAHTIGRKTYYPRKKGDVLFPERMPPKYVEECLQAAPMIVSALYQQRPQAIGGGLINSDLFGVYDKLPPMRQLVATVDTALTAKTHSDYSVFDLWGKGGDGCIYLIDKVRGKFEAPELLMQAKAFWAKHRAVSYGPAVYLGAFSIEEAAAGYGLIQQLKAQGVPCVGLPTKKDKVTRCLSFLPMLQAGFIKLPQSAKWLNDFIAECEAFTADDTHSHDDSIDTMLYAAELLLGTEAGGAEKWNTWSSIEI